MRAETARRPTRSGSVIGLPSTSKYSPTLVAGAYRIGVIALGTTQGRVSYALSVGAG